MIILQAPLPAPETSTVLPNPQLNDGEALRLHEPTIKRSMTGRLYSYIKTNPRSKLLYTFTLSRMKALELRAFIQAYYRHQIRLINHKDERWRVYFMNNPFELTTAARAGGWPGDEMVTITLEFEGTQDA